MTVAEMLRMIPREADQTQWIRGYIKGMYKQHLDYLKTSSENGNPFQSDAIQWLGEIRELASELVQKGIQVDPAVDNYVRLLANLNVPREGAILRAQARLKR
jgi:hypothetical protein